MRILVVEDDKYKRKSLENILEKENVKLIFIKAINPALSYIHDNSSDIDGIILDLDLPLYGGNNSWKTIISMGGFRIPEEMIRLGIDIPILINSYNAYTVKYEDYLYDTQNIKGKTGPHLLDFKDNILSFIESIKKGEF